MSQFNLCDVCSTIFKPDDSKYIMTITRVMQTPPIKNVKVIQESLLANQNQQQNMQILELCETCEKLLETIFTIRSKGKALEIKQIEDILKNINNIEE